MGAYVEIFKWKHYAFQKYPNLNLNVSFLFFPPEPWEP